MEQEMADPKGERLKLGFNSSLKLEFHGAKVTSDAGLLAYRGLDKALKEKNSNLGVPIHHMGHSSCLPISP